MKRFVRYIDLRMRALRVSCHCNNLLVGMAGSDGIFYSINGAAVPVGRPVFFAGSWFNF